ncbi:MAG: ATP-binding protein [Anaerolineales bacterium]|jgi:signal transduction histidine kinase
MNSPKTNQTQSLIERYLRLLDISRDLSSTLDLDSLLFQIVKAAADLTDSRDASILLYNENNNELYFQASTDLDVRTMRGQSVPVEGSLAGAIVTARQPLVVMCAEDDPRHYEEIDEFVHYKTESLLGVPLVTNEKVVGVLEALNKREGKFTQDDEQLLNALGSQAAVAIENTRLFQQSDLIAEVVHELRTPLSSIRTASYILMRPETSQEQRASMARIILQETDRLSEMTTSFLDLARLESGRSPYNKTQVDLVELLHEGAKIMESRIEEQGLTLSWNVKGDIPPFHADRDKILQVILNLLSNAVKYNRPNGDIVIGASAGDKEISFSVKDTGRGILPEHCKSLFEKFYRVPGSEKVSTGTGLGLSICQKIITGHGGRIEVDSEVGEGTAFTIYIPLDA